MSKKEHIWAIFYKISHPKFFYKGLALNDTNKLQWDFFCLEYRNILKYILLHIIVAINN